MVLQRRAFASLAVLSLCAALAGSAHADIVGAPPNVTPAPPNVTPAPPLASQSHVMTTPSRRPVRVRDCRIYTQKDQFGAVRMIRRCR